MFRENCLEFCFVLKCVPGGGGGEESMFSVINFIIHVNHIYSGFATQVLDMFC